MISSRIHRISLFGSEHPSALSRYERLHFFVYRDAIAKLRIGYQKWMLVLLKRSAAAREPCPVPFPPTLRRQQKKPHLAEPLAFGLRRVLDVGPGKSRFQRLRQQDALLARLRIAS